MLTFAFADKIQVQHAALQSLIKVGIDKRLCTVQPESELPSKEEEQEKEEGEQEEGEQGYVQL